MAEEELLKRGVVQKPAEWSEEDELNCNRIISFLEPHRTFFPTKETKEEMQSWLKNRLKSLRPQPKAELSGDIKRILDDVSHILIGLNYKQVAKEYKQAIEKLISLHP